MKKKIALFAYGTCACGILLWSGCKKEYNMSVSNVVNTASATDTGKVVTNVVQSYISFDDVVSTISKGDTMKVRLNRVGYEVRSYNVIFLSATTVGDERLIYCKIPNLVIGAGDSGSPLLTRDGRVAGALCYGFDGSNYQFAARAIEDLLSVSTSSKSAVTGVKALSDVQSIKPVYLSSGFSSNFLGRFKNHDNHGILSRYSSSTATTTASSKLASTTSQYYASVIPGMSATVIEAYGDLLLLGATGTVGYIDGNYNIYAFGHNYSSDYSPVAAPVYLADTKLFVESYSESYKYSDISGFYVGTMVADDYYGVLLKQSVSPELFTSRVAISLYGKDSLIYEHTIANNNVVSYEYDLASYIPALAINHNTTTLTGKYASVTGRVVTKTTSGDVLTDVVSFNTLTSTVDVDVYDVLYDKFINYTHHIKSQQVSLAIQSSSYADSVIVPVVLK